MVLNPTKVAVSEKITPPVAQKSASFSGAKARVEDEDENDSET
jgi:hypothetical protein